MLSEQLKKLALIIKSFFARLTPVQTLVFGYASYILLIFVPLCMPITWRVDHIGWLDHLFMATSAVSTTGLVTVNTPDAYNFMGQFILLIGFQIGGLGYMTFGSFAILASKGRVSDSRVQIGRAVFAMPEHFEPVAFIRRAVVFSLLVEIGGAVALYFAFARAGVASPLWPAIFHSVSAFCTAGFSVFPNSLESFRDDFWINFIISTLSIFGAIGFIVVSDFWLTLRSRAHKITLTSKIILCATFGGIAVGTLALVIDPTVASLPTSERWLTAFFQAMTALTTVGFNTHPIGIISPASIMIVMVLMILGASPSGTGGGLKSTSWSAGLAATWSMIRGRKDTTFFAHIVPNYRIQAAFAAFTLYLLFFVIGSFILLLADRHHFEDILFEVASGLGTVGLSRGITGELSDTGKATVIALMFIGRVGVVSLALAALARNGNVGNQSHKQADFVV